MRQGGVTESAPAFAQRPLLTNTEKEGQDRTRPHFGQPGGEHPADRRNDRHEPTDC